LPADVRWVLLRAFAPLARDAPAPSAAVVDLAAALGLDARIGARVPATRASREAGRVAAARLLQAASVVRSREDGHRELLARLASGAAARGLPLAFLKCAALMVSGRLTPGARPAADVDVLVPEERLSAARALLTDLGFRPVKGDEPDPHQIEPQKDDAGRVVEVHRWLPWLGVAGHRRATYAALAAASALAPLEWAGASVMCPREPLLAAHAISHGVAQNGFFPATYPFLRCIADLVDIESSGRLDARDVLRWLARSVDVEEAQACLALARALTDGDLGPVDAPVTPAGLILRHGVWGALDEPYRRELRAAYFVEMRRRFWRAPEARRAVWDILWPGAPAFFRLYGVPRDTLRGRLTLLARPAVMAWRLLRGQRS
jgi:hypothetical protein